VTDEPSSGRKRSLVLAGGGLKVAYQAGVLQVWLDEAGLTFDHVDGASGGTFNLAMLCQGMTGTEIADNWRRMSPLQAFQLNWRQYARLFFAASLFRLDLYRDRVFAEWRLDWDRIRASSLNATFNVYNFTRQELEVLPPARMTPEFLVACVSLPMWFPPVRIGGDTYIDPVYVTDGNLEEAIRRGADEVWVIWTVSERGEWNDGFVANYFQIIEAAANGQFRGVTRRVEENNAAIEAGRAGEFGRPIALKVLRAEVPVHYILNASGVRLAEAVNRGVEDARRWCRDRGIPLSVQPDVLPRDLATLSFTETMRGYVTFGEADFTRGYWAGRRTDTPLAAHLTIRVPALGRFLTSPEHEAPMEGVVECEALGGRLPVERGTFNLFVDDGDPTRKRMGYRVFFRDMSGRPLTLSGHKVLADAPGSGAWSETTTLYTRIVRGHVGPDEEPAAALVASGVISIHVGDFLRQLLSFRTSGSGPLERASAFGRFAAFFSGRLWDVYARKLLTYGPF
jgi:predicted acylesterase/phospholipase RssA